MFRSDRMKGNRSTLRLAAVVVLIASSFLNGGKMYGWGGLGHKTVAALAERHLTDETRKKIDRYLDNESIVRYASWLDVVRGTPEYRHTSRWHSSSVTEDGRHSLWSKKYRVYEGLGKEMQKMKDYRTMTDSAVAVGIKIIVHLVGDMHCPGHVFFKNRSQAFGFKVFGTEYLFHRFWDSGLLKIARSRSPEDYASWLDKFSLSMRDSISQGTLVEWIEENACEMKKIYEWVTPDGKYDTVASGMLVMRAGELCDSQLRKAGYRLAHILNTIFDSTYGETH